MNWRESIRYHIVFDYKNNINVFAFGFKIKCKINIKTTL